VIDIIYARELRLKVVVGILLVICVVPPCFSSQTVQTDATSPAKEVKPAVQQTAKPAASKPKSTLRTEAELSGFSSDVTDQFYSRVNVTKLTPGRKWWVKAGYGFTQSRTYDKTKINKTNVFSYTLDSEYRRDRKNGYDFISGLMNIKYPSTYKNLPNDVSGYYMFSIGRGKTISKGIEGEVALARVTVHKETVDRNIGIVYALRFNTPLNTSTTLNCDTHFVDPFTNRNLVDSRINLTYKLTQSLSMRLTYAANNIVGTALYRSDWDKSVRVALVFSRK
jgi:hypothetical protein